MKRILIMIGLAANMLFALIESAAADEAGNNNYLHGVVYELIGDDMPCVSKADGRTVGLWGNSRKYEESESIVYGGGGLKVTAKFEGGDEQSFYFFKNEEVCKNAVLSGLRTGVRIGVKIKKEWFTAKINNRDCALSESPADRIRKIQEAGSKADVTDLPNGAVRVGYFLKDTFFYYTYYRREDQCVASLPISQPISSKYE